MASDWPLSSWFPLLMLIVAIGSGIGWHRFLSGTKFYVHKIQPKGLLIKGLYFNFLLVIVYFTIGLFFIVSMILDGVINKI